MLVTSCGEDDPAGEPSAEPTWKDALGTYKSDDSRKLTLGGKEDVATTKTVILAAGTGESAKVTLTNIVPDNAAVEIDHVTMTSKDNSSYTFSGETTVDGTVISVSGTLTGLAAPNTLDVTVSRKITSTLAGTWTLGFGQTGADVILNVNSGDAATDGILNTVLKPMLGGLLAQRVTNVAVSLTEAGFFDVKWTETGKNEPTGMPDGIRDLVSVYYFVSDGALYLALEKSLIPLLTAILPEGSGIDMNALLGALAVERGDFIALPVAFEQTGDGATFHVGKNYVSALVPLLMPLLEGNLPEGLPEAILALIPALPDIVGASETFDVGLGFKK